MAQGRPMTQTPSSFDSPFLRARAVRHGRHPAPVRPSAPLEAASMIPWREFVQAVFELPAGWDYHGDLPEGISSQQFWSRVNRAAKQATRAQRGVSMGKLNHAGIGIITRGQRFWVWAEKVPPRADVDGVARKRGMIGQLMLKLRSGDPVLLEQKLTKKEKMQLRTVALRRGWKLYISDSRVQWIGEGSSQ